MPRLVILAGVATAAALALVVWCGRSEDTDTTAAPPAAASIVDTIGNTPLVLIPSLSRLTGCAIYGKLELANPGGSAKDRIARAIVLDAEARGQLRPGHRDAVYEGTSGSTGISLALLCRARGYAAHIVLPDDTSAEKVGLLERLGAVVHRVRPAGIADAGHYVNVARRLAREHTARGGSDSHGEGGFDRVGERTQAIFADQFENEANWRSHFTTTGPEVWAQTRGAIDVFVSGAGTGGTLAGVARYLKSRRATVRAVLADPQGSGLYSKVKHGVMFDAATEREGTRRRHQVDTLVEGIGINRLTRNFAAGLELVDDAYRVTDADALAMAHHLVAADGLFVGSSSAVNCVAALNEARVLGPGHTIVTVLCDSGARHLSKFWAAPVDAEQPLARELAAHASGNPQYGRLGPATGSDGAYTEDLAGVNDAPAPGLAAAAASAGLPRL